ncbi:ATP-binding cassette domain-containing protein [Aromatoleum sp.]|uniref:ATP-binding cassette domain-containing protein n=1 Tax=Aromatoleum sp. TaxID=2307007 RepID=UPI003FA567F1
MEVLESRMLALDIIQAEHRGMWRVATAIDALAEAMGEGREVQAAAETTVELLEYLDAYIDRIHHRKEDEFLFPALSRRDPAAAAAIARLEAEHRDGPAHRDGVHALAVAFRDGQRGEQQTFLDTLREFAEHLRQHMRLEETAVIPAARRALAPEDWERIDAAFAADEDPLFGVRSRGDLDALKARIIALAPEPMGLGGRRESTSFVPAPKPVRETILEIRGLTSHYGRIQALHGIDLDVKQGQLVALVGANGAGKTTLLRTISGVQPASGGVVRFGGEDITRVAPEKRVRAGICQVPEGRQVFGPMSIEDNLRLGSYSRRDREIEQDIERMFGIFPILKEKRALPAGTLSGGQQQMLAMARALMGRPKLLLLDEPSMGLAPLLVEEIFRVIRRLKAEGITIFLVEQNAHAALAIADIGYVVETGHTILSGPGPELLHDEQVKKAYLGM